MRERLGGKMRRIDEAVAQRGFWGIFCIRFFPVVPFRFSDLGFGLTGIPLRRYFLISALASPARVLFVQFFLAMGTDTILNPDRLSLYLQANPGIYAVVVLYTLGTLALAARLFRRRGRDHAVDGSGGEDDAGKS